MFTFTRFVSGVKSGHISVTAMYILPRTVQMTYLSTPLDYTCMHLCIFKMNVCITIYVLTTVVVKITRTKNNNVIAVKMTRSQYLTAFY